MSDIIITKLDETWMKVVCSEVYQELDIQDRFSFQVDNQYDPRIKNGHWDGIKKLYNRRTKRMHIGLLYHLLKFLKKQKFSYHVDPDLLPPEEILEDEDIQNLIDHIQPHDGNGNKLQPYDYQFNALKYMLNMGRSTSLLATSAGKSLIIYLLARIYQLTDELKGKHIVICVPSVALVEQIYSDFDEYSNKGKLGWYVQNHVQRISAKYAKEFHNQIIITTWQSMSNLPLWIYEDIGAIIVDETHSASAKELGTILENCTKASIRHGLTGTLDGLEMNELQIQGLLGPVKRFVTAKEIIDQGRASKIKINMCILDHNPIVRTKFHNEANKIRRQAKIANKKAGAAVWNFELSYISELYDRRRFIYDMINSVSGNSIVLFDRIEGQGKLMYEEFKELFPNRTVYLIIGEVDSNERERIRKQIEHDENSIIFASFGTMKQGVSIKRLHNAFFIAAGKAKIKVLQTVGRLMRLHETKDCGRIFDIVDDLSLDGQENAGYRHSIERVKLYAEEEHELNFERFKIPNYSSEKII